MWETLAEPHHVSLRGEVLSNNTSLTQPHFIEVPVPRHESKLSCICVLRVSSVSHSTILQLDFGTVSTVWYFLLFIFIISWQMAYPLMASLVK